MPRKEEYWRIKADPERYERLKAQNREYKRKHWKEWYAKNREKHLKRNRERRRKIRETNPERWDKFIQKLRAYPSYSEARESLLNEFGAHCALCGDTEKLIFHEKNGKKHPTRPSYIKKHKDEFIVLCLGCHRLWHALKENEDKLHTVFPLLLDNLQSQGAGGMCYRDV